MTIIKKVLIIGKGSIGIKHKKILKKIKKKINIYSVKSKKLNEENLKKILTIKKFDPDYIIISSPATYHFKHMMIIEKIYYSKIVLIEKPLFDKERKLPIKLKNTYFVGYNLRQDPVLKFIKKYLKNKNYFHVNINCSSYLPSWRKNIKYQKSVSSKKSLGGGALLELSHEIDYFYWLFGKVKILSVFNKKISELDINTDDYLNFFAKKKKTVFNLSLNFFSKIKKREIIIDGKNFSIFGDLRNGKILIFEKGKKISKIFNSSLDHSIKQQHLNIFKKRYKSMCSLNEGINVVKLINNLKYKY